MIEPFVIYMLTAIVICGLRPNHMVHFYKRISTDSVGKLVHDLWIGDIDRMNHAQLAIYYLGLLSALLLVARLL